MTAKLSADLAAKIVGLYTKDGVAPKPIAAQLGVGVSSVYRALSRAGVNRDFKTRVTGRVGIRRFIAETEKEIAVKYAAGVPVRVLQAEYDCSIDPIRTAVRRSGGKMRNRGNSPRQFTAEQIEQMARMWADGKSQSTIAAAFLSSQVTISRALALHGIQVRPLKQRGEKHGSWKGGRFVSAQRYVFVHVPSESPFASMRNTSGYVLEHRLVVAQFLSRPLTKDETVHHKNGDRTDNRLDNLQLRQGRHGRNACFRCADCGSINVIAEDL